MSMHLQRAFDQLKRSLLGLGAIVEHSVNSAAKAVATRDRALALEVIQGDDKIDRLEVEVEEEGLKVLALYQPVATDLRFVVSILKINNDLERIGDLAVNVAHKAIAISELPQSNITLVDFAEFASKVQKMLHQSLESFVNLDLKLAGAVLAADDDIDALNRDIHQRVDDLITTQGTEALRYTLLSSVSRSLERIADHATNIAEDVVYLIEGKIIRHRRRD